LLVGSHGGREFGVFRECQESALGTKALHRAVEHLDRAFAVDGSEAYNDDFGSEIEPLRLENTVFWDETVENYRYIARSDPGPPRESRLPELVSQVEDREDEIVVTRNGKPAAVLVNYDEYERLKETLDVLSDPASMRQIAESKRFYVKAQQGESFEALFGESVVAPKRRKR